MLLFAGCIFLLYVISFSRSAVMPFDKSKVLPLKSILALCIILHHLSYRTDILMPFRPLGAPIVALFFFISGYGLMYNYMRKGKYYLSGFAGKRIIKALLLPFIIALFIYCALNYQSLPSLSEAVSNMIKGNPILPYSWYVYGILIIYTVFLITAKCFAKNLIVINTIFTILFAFLLSYKGYDRCWYISLLAYPSGLLYSKYEKQIVESWNNNKVLYYSVVPFSMVLLALLVATENELAYMFAYILIPLVFVNTLSKVNIERLGRVKIIILISGLSYELYLSQGIAMSLLRSRYLYIDSHPLYIVITLLVTFAFACIIRYLGRFFIKNS